MDCGFFLGVRLAGAGFISELRIRQHSALQPRNGARLASTLHFYSLSFNLPGLFLSSGAVVLNFTF